MSTSKKRSLAKTTQSKTKLEAHESTRECIQETQNGDDEDHIAEQEYTSMSHYNLVHKLIPMPQAMKTPDAKAAVDKQWEKLQNLSAWRDSSQKQNRGCSAGTE